jgi:glycosyltransferase involved in cell wall biosynthesis
MPQRHTEPDRGNAAARHAGLLLLWVLVAGTALNYAAIHPLHNYLLDFRAYYAAGRAVQLGINPYDAAAVSAQVVLPGKQAIVRYLYPPPTLGLMYLLALLPYPAAQVFWCLFQFVLLLVALGLVLRALRCPLGSPASVLIACVLLMSPAVEQLFRWGQIDMLPTALLALGFLALTRGRSSGAGLSVGLAAVTKVTSLLYLGIFLLRWNVRALVVAAVTIVLLMVLGSAGLDGEIVARWLYALGTASQELATLISPQNMSLQAFVYRALVTGTTADEASVAWLNLGPDAARLCALLLDILLVALTGRWMWHHRRVLTDADCLAAAIPVSLLISPITWTHHGIQLLIPLALITVTTLRQPRLRACDAGWLALTLLLYTNWPLARFDLSLPSWLRHLAGPTLTYAVGLTWLFMLVRFVPLKTALPAAAAQARRPAVLMLGPSAPQIGGMVTSINLLMKSPLSERYALHRCATPPARPLSTRRASAPLRRCGVLAQSTVRHLGALLRLIVTINTRQIDVVHIHTCSRFTFYRNLLDLAVARFSGCAVVLHIRGGQFERFCAAASPLGRWLIRRGGAAADAVCVLSPHWRAALQPHLGHARLHVVPNAVELPEISSPSAPDGRPCRFLYLAPLTRAKGLSELIAAASILRTRGVALRLVIAGPDTEEPRARWERRVCAAGIADITTFAGPVLGDARQRLWADADCFVHPSHSEGLPNAVLEAGAAGLPVIATAVGSVPELMRADGDANPLSPLVPPRDAVALAGAMHRLATDAALRARIGAELHGHVAAHYNLARVSDQIARVYDEVLTSVSRSQAEPAADVCMQVRPQ